MLLPAKNKVTANPGMNSVASDNAKKTMPITVIVLAALLFTR